MDIRVLNTSFTPVTLQIKIESAAELRALKDVVGAPLLVPANLQETASEFLRGLKAALAAV